MVLKSTGKVIWNCRIYPKKDGTKIAGEKQLMIYIERENEKDKYYTVDGSGNPATIFDCKLDETKRSLNDFWKNNTIKEFIFIYSACGCPVKVMAMRVGDKTTRTRSLPVIFPDDPAVVAVIKKIMRWE